MVTPQEEYFDAYKEHSKTLRTWLVAYGIGAPILFMTNEKLVVKFEATPGARRIVLYFLMGVVLQVFLALLNKTVNWAGYFAEGHQEKKERWYSKFSCWVCDQYWIDFFVDIATIVFFTSATWRAFSVFFR